MGFPQPVQVDPALATLEGTSQFMQASDDHLTELKQQLQTVQQRIAALELEREELLPIEADRLAQLNRELGQKYILGKQNPLGLYLKELDLIQDIALWEAGYTSWMTFDPLMWRSTLTGLPMLALFTLSNPDTILSIQWYNNIHTSKPRPDIVQNGVYLEGKFPREWMNLYRDLDPLLTQPPYVPSTQSIVNASSGGIHVQLSARFTGTIPPESRAKIRAAVDSGIFTARLRPGAGHTEVEPVHIFLVAEVPTWAVKIVSPPRPVVIGTDPLVVGWIERYPDRLWYIDAFDITSLENRIPLT